MIAGELKPILAALVLPPTGPLLLALLGVLLLLARRRGAGGVLALAGVGGLLLLSCQAVGFALAAYLLPNVEAAQLAQVKRMQAIVVLGGGVSPYAPEYGAAQPGGRTLARLRYGAWLARHTGLPLAFAGGVGWTAVGTGAPTEAEVAVRAMEQDWGLQFRWLDSTSRDTQENAVHTHRLLAADGVTQVALVTDAWHMPRSEREFRAAGFEVLPAPTGMPVPSTRSVLQWLPSADGLSLSSQVLREWLALTLNSIRGSTASPA